MPLADHFFSSSSGSPIDLASSQQHVAPLPSAQPPQEQGLLLPRSPQRHRGSASRLGTASACPGPRGFTRVLRARRGHRWL